MYAWYTVLLRQRLLFSGTAEGTSLEPPCRSNRRVTGRASCPPMFHILTHTSGAHAVGLCCISVPLMILPLFGFHSCIFPYVPITNVEPLSLKTYIAGITNPLFEDKSTKCRTSHSLTPSVLCASRFTPVHLLLRMVGLHDRAQQERESALSTSG